MQYIHGMVSVIMPSYNTGRFIAESIDSVLMQTYSNLELIIIDDCSTDDTDSIVELYSDERLIYYKNKNNCGAAVSRNIGLQKARGEWIAFLDSDDLWLPNKLETQINWMKENDIMFSCTSRVQIDETGKEIGIREYGPRKVGKIGMYCYGWPGTLTVVYHAPTVGIIQIADLKKNNDYALWLKVIQKADCYYLNEILSKYRVRSGSLSHGNLIKYVISLYIMYRKSENKNILLSLLFTLINIFFGVYKKMVYVRKY